MRVSSEAELCDVVASAKGPLRITGAGTRVKASADCVDLSGLTGITLYEPGALTLVAKAGTPVEEIETRLAEEGQRLAFEPYKLRAGPGTIGGVVATNASGPRRIQAGAVRDFCLGARFVDGTGRLIKNGGRVMKNVTGYDLVKLVAGSWGTLGALSEISLKVLPMPETAGNLVLHTLDARAAVAAMSDALGSPYEVSGAAHLPEKSETWLRVEGFETQVSYRLSRLKERLGRFGEISVKGDFAWTALTHLDALIDQGDLWRISVRPSDGPSIAERLPDGAQWMMDWGGGLLWASVPAGTDVRAALGAFAGHATLMIAAPGTFKRLGRFQPEPAGVAALTQGLRKQFDPKALFALDQAA